METLTLGRVRYLLQPVRPDDPRVPYELLGEVRYMVIACFARTPAQDAGWITADPGRRGKPGQPGRRRGRGGPWSCFAGISMEHLTGPALAWQRNVRRPGAGLAVVAAAYSQWLAGGDLPGTVVR